MTQYLYRKSTGMVESISEDAGAFGVVDEDVFGVASDLKLPEKLRDGDRLIVSGDSALVATGEEIVASESAHAADDALIARKKSREFVQTNMHWKRTLYTIAWCMVNADAFRGVSADDAYVLIRDKIGDAQIDEKL